VRLADLRARARDRDPGASFAHALQSAPDVAVIAEIKRRSPSLGDIRPELSAGDQAARYEAGGARAISVLTEPSEFGGSVDDIAAASAAAGLPILRKDFHVSAVQVVEAAAAGASALLLIARALDPSLLVDLAGEAAEWKLDRLVEVRDEDELTRALALDGAVIGVNNRDLETLVIDNATCERLIPLVPAGRIAVGESGVRARSDVERLAATGANAVLVGSALSSSDDAEAAVRALTGVTRTVRAD
jgi:indole-3-glycerol phosphate synthase